jgi:seryl-tRNA synthetase
LSSKTVTTPGQTKDALTELAGCAQGLVENLNLHYQTTLPATRDASANMGLTYDIEACPDDAACCRRRS